MTGWTVLMAFIGLTLCPVVEGLADKFTDNRTIVKWIVLVWIALWTIPPLFLMWTKGVFG